jgi:hypothetical protein
MLCKLTRSYVCRATFRRKFLVPTPSAACNFPPRDNGIAAAATAKQGRPLPPPPHQPHTHVTTPPVHHRTRTKRGVAAQRRVRRGGRSGLPLAGAPQLFLSQSPRHRRSIDSDSAWLWRLPVTASAAAAARSRFVAAPRWLLVAFVSTRAIGDPAFSVLGCCSASATTVAFPSPISFAVIDRRRWRRSRSRPASSESTLPSSSRYRLLSLKIRVILIRTNHGRVTGVGAKFERSLLMCLLISLINLEQLPLVVLGLL